MRSDYQNLDQVLRVGSFHHNWSSVLFLSPGKVASGIGMTPPTAQRKPLPLIERLIYTVCLALMTDFNSPRRAADFVLQCLWKIVALVRFATALRRIPYKISFRMNSIWNQPRNEWIRWKVDWTRANLLCTTPCALIKIVDGYSTSRLRAS